MSPLALFAGFCTAFFGASAGAAGTIFLFKGPHPQQLWRNYTAARNFRVLAEQQRITAEQDAENAREELLQLRHRNIEMSLSLQTAERRAELAEMHAATANDIARDIAEIAEIKISESEDAARSIRQRAARTDQAEALERDLRSEMDKALWRVEKMLGNLHKTYREAPQDQEDALDTVRTTMDHILNLRLQLQKPAKQETKDGHRPA